MKTQSKLQLFALGVSATLSTFSIMSAPTLAATVQVGSNSSCSATATGNDLLINFGGDETAFSTNCGITQIGKVEGRTGGNSTYEMAIGPNGAQTGLTGNIDLQIKIGKQIKKGWQDNKAYYWTLNWNPTPTNANGTATFSFFNDSARTQQIGSTINYNFTGTLDTFNALGLVVRADNRNEYGTGTTMNLTLDSVTLNGNNTQLLNNFSITATSNPNNLTRFNKQFLTINPNKGTEITQLMGTVTANFANFSTGSFYNPNPSLQSNGIGFQLILLDPPIKTVSVPEPGVMLGLFGVGFLGTLKKRQNKN